MGVMYLLTKEDYIKRKKKKKEYYFIGSFLADFFKGI